MAKCGCGGRVYEDDSTVPFRLPGPYPFQHHGQRIAFEVKLKKEGLFARVDMPGVGEDEVEVFVQDNTTVVFKGQALKEAEENSNQYDSPRTYMGSFNLFFDPDQSRKIRTEVKCGVLRFFVPAMVKEKEDTICLISTNNPSPPSLIFTVPLPESSEDANKNPFQCGGPNGSFERFVTTEDKMFVRVDMPGADMESTDIFFSKDKTVVFYGSKAAEEWEEFDKEGRSYFSDIGLCCGCCRFSDVKGNVINGVLRFLVSKVNFKNVPCPSCNLF